MVHSGASATINASLQRQRTMVISFASLVAWRCVVVGGSEKPVRSVQLDRVVTGTIHLALQ